MRGFRAFSVAVPLQLLVTASPSFGRLDRMNRALSSRIDEVDPHCRKLFTVDSGQHFGDLFEYFIADIFDGTALIEADRNRRERLESAGERFDPCLAAWVKTENKSVGFMSDVNGDLMHVDRLAIVRLRKYGGVGVVGGSGLNHPKSLLRKEGLLKPSNGPTPLKKGAIPLLHLFFESRAQMYRARFLNN